MLDIAPKLIWAFGRVTFDTFVIVGTSQVANDLFHLLEQHQFPMRIVVLTNKDLENFLLESKSVAEYLGLDIKDNYSPSLETIKKVEFQTSNPVLFDVVHQEDPPESFDYISLPHGIVKAYSNRDFNLLGTLINNMEYEFLVNKLYVQTLDFQRVDSRVLRLTKAKGLYTPPKLRFNPDPAKGGKKEILKEKVFRVSPRTTENMEFSLQIKPDSKAGLYKLIFIVEGYLRERKCTLYSPIFYLHVLHKNTDILALHVRGVHYDTAVEKVMGLQPEIWSKLKEDIKNKNFMYFLGPTFHEINNGIIDETWKIRSVSVIPRKSRGKQSGEYIAMENPSIPSAVYYDIGEPIAEELASTARAEKRVLGVHEWQNIYPYQIKRKKLDMLE